MASKSYQMWLTFDGGNKKLKFPVLPEKIDVSYGSRDKSVDISGLGEIIIKQDRPAIVIDFSGFFPATYFPNIKVKTVQSPQILKNRIKNWKNSRKPCQFLITGTDINMFCYIDSFKYQERGGDVGSIHYSIKLKEYREVAIRRLEADSNGGVKASTAKGTPRTDNRVQNRTYKVKEGDTLYSIAAKTLGNGAKWMDILKINQDVIKNPNLLQAGTVVKMPDVVEMEVAGTEKKVMER